VEAVAAAERAVACAPQYADAHHTLSNAFQTQTQRFRPRTAHDPQRALAAADEAVRLAPTDVDVLNTRAWALVLLERRREALREYRRILELSPNSSRAVNGLGWLHRSRRPILAARYYTQALALDPQSEVIKINLLGALKGWIYRMIWIWLWGGLALGLVRWFVPQELVWTGLAGIVATSVLGSCLILRHIPRGTLRIVLTASSSSLVPMPARLVGSVAVAVLGLLGPPPVSAVALVTLAAFVLLEWKVDFTNADRKLMSWVRRRS
jgi:tetratricopeptide (TPR) repeat protein